MAPQYSEIQELLRRRADYQMRLNLMPYDGTPEIKEKGDGKYLYVRKRAAVFWSSPKRRCRNSKGCLYATTRARAFPS